MAKILSNSFRIEEEKRETHMGPSLDVTRIWYIESDNGREIHEIIEEEFKKEFSTKDVYKYLSVELKEDGTVYVYFSVKLDYASVSKDRRRLFVVKQKRMMRRISDRLKAL